MSIQRSYEFDEVGEGALAQIRDALGAGGFGLFESIPREGRRRLTVEAKDERALEYAECLIEDLRKSQRRLRQRVELEREARELLPCDVDATLRESGDALHLGEGLWGLEGETLRLFDFFEAEFEGIAREEGAREQRYPVMLPLEVLEELGYFTHFPQQVTFCSHLPEDLPLLEQVVQSAGERDGGLAEAWKHRLEPARHALKPAVCLPCYRQFRGRVFEPGSCEAVSMQNHVFRFESQNFRSLSRLWDFTVRDVVYFGDEATLHARRQGLMQRAFELCEELDLGARVQLANDPFFLDESRDKRVYQRMGEVKFELVLDLPFREEELAVSSFNLHRDFYTSRYDVRFSDGARVESACVGFGIERWVYGFLAQKGFDPVRWPARVRDAVAGVGPARERAGRRDGGAGGSAAACG